MVSETANVNSTDIMVIVAGFSRDTSRRCMRTPVTKNNGTVTTSDSSGSSPVCSWKYHARYAARMRNAVCAIITTRMMPKYRVSPAARRA